MKKVPDEIILIFDGQCRLCKASVAWVEKKLSVQALAFQTADLSRFHLTLAQCEQEVFVLAQGRRLSGAPAVAYLMQARGNTVLAGIIRSSGPLGRISYRWIAGHRNSLPVRALTWLLESF